MAKYIYIEDYSKKGKFAISNEVFAQLANQALKKVPGVYFGDQKDKSKKLHNSVKTYIHHGIVHVSVSVDIAKGTNIQATSLRIQNEIINLFMECVDQVPFDIQVKINSIIA